MSRVSEPKKQKISEQILSVLYDSFPKPLFTSNIAKQIVRDEEFTKILLTELNQKGVIIPINKNPLGVKYSRRIRWRLSTQAHQVYLKQAVSNLKPTTTITNN